MRVSDVLDVTRNTVGPGACRNRARRLIISLRFMASRTCRTRKSSVDVRTGIARFMTTAARHIILDTLAIINLVDTGNGTDTIKVYAVKL